VRLTSLARFSGGPGAAMRLGYPTFPVYPVPRCQRGFTGWVHRRPIGSGRGGAAVVLRGRESRSHGEGRQR
jgi:hypothetical protein